MSYRGYDTSRFLWSNISVFFRGKKPSLFRFNASSTGISLTEVGKNSDIQSSQNSITMYKQTQNKDAASGPSSGGAGAAPASAAATEVVCPPNPHNVTLIYSCLMDFIASIEETLKYEPGKHCALYGFLMDYIKDVFLGQVRRRIEAEPIMCALKVGTKLSLAISFYIHSFVIFSFQIHADNSDTLNEASVLLDSWKAITDMEVLRDHRANRPLLQVCKFSPSIVDKIYSRSIFSFQSAVLVKKAIDDLFRFMQDLPLYREHFLTMVCQSVMQYKVSTAQAIFYSLGDKCCF